MPLFKSAKDTVLEAINRLPADASFDDIMGEIAFLAGLQKSSEDVEHGRIISNEEMRRRLAAWFAN